MTYVLGIDFGSSSTAASAITDADSSRRPRVVTLGNRSAAVPSAVFVRDDGSLLFGEEAYQRGLAEPARFVRELKRKLGQETAVTIDGQRLAVEELIGASLAWVMARVTEREGGPPRRVVLAHPANWKERQLDGYRRAASHGGLGNAEFISEPLAAALFHLSESPVPVGGHLAVYDLGGGTFDAAVLRRISDGDDVNAFELAGYPEGIEHLGGIDFDDLVRQAIQSKLGTDWNTASTSVATLAALRRECVIAKETLSTEPTVEVPVLLPTGSRAVPYSRHEFEHVLRPFIADTIGVFRRALVQANVAADQLAGVLLVGGSCQIPLVRQMVVDSVGPDVAIYDADPKHAVARGAAASADLAAAATPSVTAAAPLPPPLLPSDTPVGDVFAPVPMGSSAPAAGASRRGARRWLPVAAVVTALAVGGGAFALTRGDGDTDVIAAQPTPSSATTSAATTSSAAPVGTATTASNAATTSSSAPAPTSSSTSTSTTRQGAAAAAAKPASAANMVPIAAGTYQLGAPVSTAEVAPLTSVTMKTFFIDADEVANSEFNTFLQVVGGKTPRSWPRGKMPDGQATHPVTGVEWAWAQAYCASLEKRLPTEAEWEAAARGTDGRVYPWGNDVTAVDLETAGTRARDPRTANVSPFGVRDTVGGVWEWVADAYAPVPEGQKVRRGGEYGHVREGVTWRQVVDPANESVITETGFRCAADLVDPALPLNNFVNTHALPSVTANTPATTIATTGTQLVVELFENPTSGWPDKTDPATGTKVGYHAPSLYHVEASKPETSVVALGGFAFPDAVVETTAFVDKTDTQTGKFRYGIMVRASGPLRPPLSGSGNLRPQEYYAFVVNPRENRWDLLHEDNRPQRVVAGGELPAPLRATDPANPDVLRVETRGTKIDLFINDQQVGTLDTRGYHMKGDIGFYVETLDETKVHVHFDRFEVRAP